MNKKLRTTLLKSIARHAEPPFTETSIVKLLADVRKLLEEVNEEHKYPTLKLFCNWVLHSRLSGKKIQQFLSEIDEAYDLLLADKNSRFRSDLGAKILSFLGFEGELQLFLNKYGIAIPPISARDEWYVFESVYCGIVGDCRLEYKNKKPLKHIDSAQVSLNRADETLKPAQLTSDVVGFPFGMRWIFTRNGTEVFRMFLSFPDCRPKLQSLHPSSTPQMSPLPPR